MPTSWAMDESFPLANGEWRSWRPPLGRLLKGEAKVRHAIRNWHPFDPLLVSKPGGRHMLPPICFNSLAPLLLRRARVRFQFVLMLCLCMALGFLGAGTALRDDYLLKCGLVLVLLLALACMQYTLTLGSQARTQAYSRFCAWCYLQPIRPLIPLAAVPVLGGAAQLCLQGRAGSLFSLIEEYGLLFQAAPVEPWRYLTGPFFHSGIVHWLGNFSLWVLTAGLALCIGRPLAIWCTCMAGVVLPPLVLAHLPHWVGSDAFVGLSGGVFALLGWLTAATWIARSQFPSGIWALIGCFAVVSAVAASLLDFQASGFVHASSGLLGVFAGSTRIVLKPQFRPTDLAAVK